MKNSLDEVAKECGPLLRSRSWLHRRVHKIRLKPNGVASSDISIDFTLPAALKPYEGPLPTGECIFFVPLIGLRKWPPLSRLDLRDQHGDPFPLLTTERNRTLDAEAIVQIAPPGLLRDAAEPLLRKVPGEEDPNESIDILNSLGQLILAHAHEFTPFERECWGEAIVAAGSLATNFLLWARVTARPEERLVVKVSYDVSVADEPQPLSRRLYGSLSWAPLRLRTVIHDMGVGGSYHLLVEPSETLEVHRATLRTLSPLEALQGATEPNAPPTRRDRIAGLAWTFRNTIRVRLAMLRRDVVARVMAAQAERPGPGQPYILHEDRLAHLYVSGRRARVGIAEVDLASQRAGIKPAAVLLGLLVTVLMGTMAAIATRAKAHVEAAVVVLVIAPSLLAYVLARPRTAVTQARLTGVRALVALAAAVPIAASLSLLSFGEGGGSAELKVCWWTLTAVSAVVTGLLALSWLLPPIKDPVEKYRNAVLGG